MSDGSAALENALRLQQAGDHDAAERVLRDLLLVDPDNGDGLHLMGLSLYARGRHAEALEWVERAIAAQPDEAMFLTNAGSIALALGDLDRAGDYQQRAVRTDPLHVEAWNNLALVREREGRLEEAQALLEKATALRPDFAEALVNLGHVLRGLGRPGEAVDAYQRAIEVAPRLAAAHNGLGNTLRLLDRPDEARLCFERAIAIDPGYADARFNHALTLAGQGETDAAAAGLREAIAIRRDPRFLIADAGLLPVIPKSIQEIRHWRDRFRLGFERLLDDGLRFDGNPLQAPAMSFYLAYHGENDRAIMETLTRFYATACPSLDWVAPHCLAGRSARHDGPIRVGILSRYFGEHAVAWMIHDLVAHLPRDRFEIQALTLFQADAPVADRMRAAVDRVVWLPYDLEAAREAIAALELDVLLYADIGMEAFSYFLAFARLALVQCVTWGHPDTTGLASIDYYISNDLAEPDDAQDSYTEQLARLAGVQSRYPRLPRPDPVPDRAALGLPGGGAIYLCPQNLIKIHPEMDAALAAILRRDATGHLVIFEAKDANWTRLLLERWRDVFGPLMDRVVVLPRRPLDGFIAVIAAADVVLDTWPFGAGNTNYQTFAMGVPVVTLPGRWIRGRGTLAHYRHMEIEDCIAASPEAYVDIAVRLGTDRPWREMIAERIRERSDAVLEDDGCVRAFADFLESVVR